MGLKSHAVGENGFYARQHICYSAYTVYAIARPSLCLSDGWIIAKRLKLGLWNYHHTSSFAG